MEHIPSCERTAVDNFKHPDVADWILTVGGAGVGDVESRFVGAEGQPVRTLEIRGDRLHRAIGRIHPVDVAGQFLLGPVALVVRYDPVMRVREPDCAVGLDHNIVGRIESPALEPVCQDLD